MMKWLLVVNLGILLALLPSTASASTLVEIQVHSFDSGWTAFNGAEVVFDTEDKIEGTASLAVTVPAEFSGLFVAVAEISPTIDFSQITELRWWGRSTGAVNFAFLYPSNTGDCEGAPFGIAMIFDTSGEWTEDSLGTFSELNGVDTLCLGVIQGVEYDFHLDDMRAYLPIEAVPSATVWGMVLLAMLLVGGLVWHRNRVSAH